MRNVFRLCVFVIFIFLTATAIYAQDGEASVISEALFSKESGDQSISFYLGLNIPLANNSFAGEYFDPKMTLGGTLGLTWSVYISSLMFAGGGLELWIAASDIGIPLYNFALFAEFGIAPRLAQFEFPLAVGFGLNNMTYNSLYKTDFLIRSSASAMWNFVSRWSIGATVHYSMIVQSYFGPLPPSNDSRLHHKLIPGVVATLTL